MWSSKWGVLHILNELPELLFDEGLGWQKESNNNVAFSIFYHLSTFRSAKRAYAMSLADCNCSAYESYVYSGSPFFCSEDKLIPSAEVLDLIQEKIMKVEYSNNKRFIPKETIDYIKQSGKEYLPASDIDLILRQEFNDFWIKTLTENGRKYILKVNGIEFLDKKDLIVPCSIFLAYNGADCGCCGNYSGRCYACSWICFEHDIYCMTCDKPWYICGTQCKPGCPNYF